MSRRNIKNSPEDHISAFFCSRSARSSTSSGENTNLRPSGPIFKSLAIFTVVVLAVVLAYCLRDGGFHIEYSISRYVGREMWSAVIFALGNMVIVWEMWRYVQAVWQKYGRGWLVVMIILMVCFVGLSLCPIGLFDETYGDYGVVSILHQVFSRGMFAMMALAVAIMSFWRRKERKMLVAGIVYIIYAMVCAVMSVTTQVFWDWNFVLETVYICGFFIILML